LTCDWPKLIISGSILNFFLVSVSPWREDGVAAKPVETDSSILVSLAEHAQKVLQEFVGLRSADKHRASELVAELEHVVAEFRRLRPPPPLRGGLRLMRPPGGLPHCPICEDEIHPALPGIFETPGATYHLVCYRRAIGLT
jgi:hypothetical protein